MHGRIPASPSKSYTHRAMVLAGLAHGTSNIKRPLLSADTLATLNGMKQFGSSVTMMDDLCSIRGGSLECPQAPIDCANSGTTLRLLSGIASLLPCAITLTGDESLQQRPMKPLILALKEMGVQCTSQRNDGNPPIIVHGPNRGRWAHIKGDISSQFISSLLISSPLKDLDTDVVLTSPLISKPYVDITLEMMAKFGVKCDATKDGFHITGGQRYEPHDYRIPGDFSSAAFPLAAAALGGKVSLSGLDLESRQGDRVIVSILERMGAGVRWSGGMLEVTEGPLVAIEADMSNSPDLFPIVAVLATQAQGRSRLFNASHLRFKETDRIKTTAAFLKAMGASVEEREDGCIVNGPTRLHGASLDSFGDHRILMSASVAALVADGRTVIRDEGSHLVSYPDFVKDMKAIGADLEVIN